MKKTFSIIGGLFLLLYIFIAAGVVTGRQWVESLDMYFIRTIQSTVTEPGASIISVLTDIGGTEAIVVLTLAVTITLFIKKMYTAGMWFGLTILISPGIFVHVMKPIIGRDRPEFMRLAAESTHSFPSGHSSTLR